MPAKVRAQIGATCKGVPLLEVTLADVKHLIPFELKNRSAN